MQAENDALRHQVATLQEQLTPALARIKELETPRALSSMPSTALPTALSGCALVSLPGGVRSTIYGRGELAEAEPAVPGWVIAVNELFD